MTTSQDALKAPSSQHRGAEDAAWLSQVGLGDERAIASLYDRYSTLVYSVALKVCGNSNSAEEVLQNIFMRIWLTPQQFASEPGSLDGRLVVLSRNLAIDHVRRKSRATDDEPSLNSQDSAVSHLQVSRLMQKPHPLVLLLPDANRQVLEMAFFEGKSRDEIAEETGFPIDTIGGRLCGALADLRAGAADAVNDADDTGLEVLDLDTHSEFAARCLHSRDIAVQMEGLRRLTHSFVESPDTILQELVNAAVELCGADSAGISLEIEGKSDAKYWHWVATAGQYNGFLNAVLPRYPSACGICLERGKPQLFKVGKRFFDIMGIEAPLVTDGILLPWQVQDTRGTIFIMAHGRTAAFDRNDSQLMRVLADFAAMAVRQQRQQRVLLEQAKAAASADTANRLAHQVNNPLQSLMQVAYLAAEGQGDKSAKTLGQEITVELHRLSAVVKEALALPGGGFHKN